jgi:hypothetical protein
VPELARAIGPVLAPALNTINAIVPSPTELLMLSILRHGPRHLMPHAALVTGVALCVARLTGLEPDLMRALARAALLHDIGQLYLDPRIFAEPRRCNAQDLQLVRQHSLLGARVAQELVHSDAGVARMIQVSHERLDGSGYPAGLAGAALSGSEQVLLFAEAMAPDLEAGDHRLVRAAVAARLVPGEFPKAMVSLFDREAQASPAPTQLGAPAQLAIIGDDLRQLHTLIAQAVVLLRMTVCETRTVREHAQHWLPRLESFLLMLRSTGVEAALAYGMQVEPQDAREQIELTVLRDELRQRLDDLRRVVEIEQSVTPELGATSLVYDLIDVLRGDDGAGDGVGGIAQDSGFGA